MKASIILKSIFILTLSTVVSSSGLSQTLNEPKTVCEFISETAKAVNTNLIFENMEKDKSSPFVRDYLVQKVIWEDKSKAPNLAIAKTKLPTPQASDYYEKYVRWSHNVGYLPYMGEWFKVFAKSDSGAIRSAKSTGAFISSVGGQSLICAFKSGVKETSVPERVNWSRNANFEGLNCNKAIEPKNITKANIPVSKEIEDRLILEMGKDYYEGWFKRNAHFAAPMASAGKLPFTDGPILKVDINNDGSKENLVRVNYSESGNSPCGTFYYDILSEDLTQLGNSKLRDALFEAQGMTLRDDGIRNLNCGRSHTVLSVDGKNYISSSRSLSRHIVAIKNGEAVKLCTSKFTVEPVIVFDAMTKDTQ